MTKARCPVCGCATLTDRSKVFCRSHWFSLPKPLRDAIWATYRAKPFNRSDHLGNIMSAMRYMRDKEKAS